MEFVPGRNLAARDYFAPLKEGRPIAPFAKEAESIERNARIEDHEFFRYARSNSKALVLWASQEAVVTNPFSQILFTVLARIPNVHVRSILMPVVVGEHSAVRHGVADKSHPWLIWRLCQSLGLTETDIVITEAVTSFIEVLENSAQAPMRALGVLGIGNERMLIAEYRAVEACFDQALPSCDYKDFLHANIGEDETHTRLIAEAASAMATMGYDPEEFIFGAKEGVAARVRYYDALFQEAHLTC
jgi:hypothetical protein